MILECPECHARYNLPDHAVGARGRKVRCAKCHHQWHQAPSEPVLQELVEAPPPRSTPAPTAAPKKPTKSAPKAPIATVPLGLKIATIFTAALALVLCVVLTEPGWIGIPRSTGLMLGDVGILKTVEDEHLYYQISGRIANTTDKERKLPMMRITLVDGEGTPIRAWKIPPSTDRISAADSIAFTTDKLEIFSDSASRFVVEIGSSLELPLRRKPGPAPQQEAPAS